MDDPEHQIFSMADDNCTALEGEEGEKLFATGDGLHPIGRGLNDVRTGGTGMRAALSRALNVRLALLAVYHYLLCWLSLVENMVPINCRIFVCILVVSPVCDTNTIDTSQPIALLRWHHHHPP